MSLDEALCTTEGVLPGRPSPDGEIDPRCQAIIAYWFWDVDHLRVACNMVAHWRDEMSRSRPVISRHRLCRPPEPLVVQNPEQCPCHTPGQGQSTTEDNRA